jgi:NIMA (never in mitosis gene a)-related kinase
LRSLEHPNIVAYFSTFVETTKLYIVMEFADGGDLSAAIKERQPESKHFPEVEALRMFTQCCLALQHCHSRHILHRDLKSQNIFLTKSGTVKLGDFGIAKVLDHTQAEAMTLIGTPVYLAPEVCDNRPYGIKADIWSIGVVMYEICALAQPFRAENLAALMMRILREDPDPLPQNVYSGEVQTVVSWMLKKNPDERPTVDELLATSAVQPIAAKLQPDGQNSQPKMRPISRESSARRPPSNASDRGVPLPVPTPSSSNARAVASAASPSSKSNADALDDFLGNRRAAEQAKQRAQGGGAARYFPGAQFAGDAAMAQVDATALKRPPVGDAVSDFHRNREIAAQAKARAEADNRGAVREQPRCSSLDPSLGNAQGRRGRAAEGEHLQQLADAAAQARRDRRLVQQRMQELDQPEKVENNPLADSGGYAARLLAKKSAEDARLQELSEAAAQARRDRRQIQQKMQELERPKDDGTRKLGDCEIVRSCSEPVNGSRRNRQEAENKRLKELLDAAAESRKDRLQIQQKMQELERPTSKEQDRDTSAEARTEERGGSASSRAARKKAEEEKHLQALQDAAAEARRERLQLRQKHESGTPREGDAPEVAHASSSSNARSRSASRRQTQEASPKQVMQDEAAQTLSQRRDLEENLNAADEKLMSDIEAALPGYPSPGTERKALRDPRSSPPLLTPPQMPGLGSSFEQRSSMGSRQSLKEVLGSSQASKGPGSPLLNRSRSSEASAESSPQRHRPVGRSSSLGLAGNLLARSDSRSRQETKEGAKSAPVTVSPQPVSSPQFGVPDDAPCRDESPSFGGTWSSKNLRLLRPISVDDKNASAEFGQGLNNKAASSRPPRIDAGEKVEDIVVASQPNMLSSTLRLPPSLPETSTCPDLAAPDTPAEELLALKLSRLKSPPPFRRSASREGLGTGSVAESNFSLGLSDHHAASSQSPTPPLQSENPTLGSLSYTGTCTLSSKLSTMSCIAAK